MRWDGDEQRRDVADAGRLGPHLAALLEAAHEFGWVAEEPDRHLLPHLVATLEVAPKGLALISSRIDGGALELTLSKPEGMGHREIRGAIYRLLGAVAESATFVRELVEPESRRYEACTGTLKGDGPFAGHGHVLCFVIPDAGAMP